MTTRPHLKNVIKAKMLVHIVFLVVLNIISFTVLNREYHDQKTRILDNYSAVMQSKVEASLGVFAKFSHYVYQQISQDTQIMALFQEAVESPGPVRDTNRQQIYQRLKPNYELLKQHHFRQLHFHFANGDSFLRVHKPEKYGDNLFAVRESVRLANIHQQIIEGFEEGKVFNGYRFVYPLTFEQQALGSVEASLSMGSILDLLFELYPKDDFYFVIDKSTVDAKLFEDMKGNYIPTLLSEHYYYDKAVFEQNLEKIKYKDILANVENLGADLEPLIEGENTFSQVITIANTDYILSFISFKNFKNQHVAYLITSSQDTAIGRLNNTFMVYALLILLVSFIYVWNIYSEHAYKKELVHFSNTDFLTKLFNRNKFTENLTFEFVKYREARGTFSVVLFDIDHFKKINDGMGHNVGDAYLKELSDLISAKVRHSDTFARWGGEEFILLLPNTPENNALKVAEVLRQLVESHRFSAPKNITISVGVAEVNDRDTNIDDVIARADSALYKSKDAGRNRTTAWSQLVH
ncbi:sensor domain-containing diguanylate cyclase [Vibrio sp. JPW-9-11-11]|uniref:sensor domain-containing diguanylate cyclase n=1 Tax=Vibrio sp. JPW-9-11-11 TaxID=1416532 RepID=UPI0034E8B9DF